MPGCIQSARVERGGEVPDAPVGLGEGELVRLAPYAEPLLPANDAAGGAQWMFARTTGGSEGSAVAAAAAAGRFIRRSVKAAG